MKNILVPIDFYPSPSKAGEYAAIIAKVFDAKVSLLHVFSESVLATKSSLTETGTFIELQEENGPTIKKEIKFLKEKYGVEVNGFNKIGSTADTISSTAKSMQADLIVMSTKQREHISTGTILSVAKKTKAPMLIVPENVSLLPIRHVVLATDFDKVSKVTQWGFLINLVKKLDASLQVFHIHKKNAEMKTTEVEGKQQLERVLSGVSYWYTGVNDNDVKHGIENFIESRPVDLLVMVAHHHNLIERVFATVHIKPIIKEIKLPMLILEDE
jgi:nucleotide-binding universal stress UspA family protein